MEIHDYQVYIDLTPLKYSPLNLKMFCDLNEL